MMPDPDAGLRLTKLGAKVNFRKGKFRKPVKVKGPAQWSDPETKRAKMAEHEVWLVTIELPLKYINHGIDELDDVIQKDIDATNAELADAYEQEQPDDIGMGADMQGNDMGMGDQGMGDQGAMPPEGEEGMQ